MVWPITSKEDTTTQNSCWKEWQCINGDNNDNDGDRNGDSNGANDGDSDSTGDILILVPGGIARGWECQP